MKVLYLLRHAKSSWKDAELSDIDRPLNRRGKKNAPEMGKYLRKNGVNPQLIISSPAKRAFQTSTLLSDKLGYEEKNIKIDMSLYGANTDELIKLIHGIDDTLKRVMLVGHNPGFTQVIAYLSDYALDNLPTCGLAEIRFNCRKWENVKKGKGRLERLEFPKSLEGKKKRKQE